MTDRPPAPTHRHSADELRSTARGTVSAAIAGYGVCMDEKPLPKPPPVPPPTPDPAPNPEPLVPPTEPPPGPPPGPAPQPP
ncbi:hypothetical protein E1287_24115, partial [Actinomadura sp. KC06]|uniref:hypothetical protein n=1 Tax=Actinomadura sp. KC06 TaxID=2530369 RepID=UPI0010D1E144